MIKGFLMDTSKCWEEHDRIIAKMKAEAQMLGRASNLSGSTQLIILNMFMFAIGTALGLFMGWIA